MGTEIQCLFGYCLLRPLTNDTNTSGIVSPSSVSIPSTEARVLACGTGSPDGAGATIPMQVKVGDTVHFDSSKTKEVRIDGETLYYADQLAIFSIVQEKKDA